MQVRSRLAVRQCAACGRSPGDKLKTQNTLLGPFVPYLTRIFSRLHQKQRRRLASAGARQSGGALAKLLRHAPQLKSRFSATQWTASHGRGGIDAESRYRFVTGERVPAGDGRVAERRCCPPAGVHSIRRQHAQSTSRGWFQRRAIRRLPFNSPCERKRWSASCFTVVLAAAGQWQTARWHLQG